MALPMVMSGRVAAHGAARQTGPVRRVRPLILKGLGGGGRIALLAALAVPVIVGVGVLAAACVRCGLRSVVLLGLFGLFVITQLLISEHSHRQRRPSPDSAVAATPAAALRSAVVGGRVRPLVLPAPSRWAYPAQLAPPMVARL